MLVPVPVLVGTAVSTSAVIGVGCGAGAGTGASTGTGADASNSTSTCAGIACVGTYANRLESGKGSIVEARSYSKENAVKRKCAQRSYFKYLDPKL